MGNLYFQYRDGFPDNLNKVFIETETKNQITYADLEKHSAAYSVGFEKLGLISQILLNMLQNAFPDLRKLFDF